MVSYKAIRPAECRILCTVVVLHDKSYRIQLQSVILSTYSTYVTCNSKVRMRLQVNSCNSIINLGTDYTYCVIILMVLISLSIISAI